MAYLILLGNYWPIHSDSVQNLCACEGLDSSGLKSNKATGVLVVKYRYMLSGSPPWPSGSALDSRVEGRGFDTALGQVS